MSLSMKKYESWFGSLNRNYFSLNFGIKNRWKTSTCLLRTKNRSRKNQFRVFSTSAKFLKVITLYKRDTLPHTLIPILTISKYTHIYYTLILKDWEIKKTLCTVVKSSLCVDLWTNKAIIQYISRYLMILSIYLQSRYGKLFFCCFIIALIITSIVQLNIYKI